MSMSIFVAVFTNRFGIMFIQPSQLEALQEPPCSNNGGSDDAAVVDYNFQDFVSVDAFVASASVDFDFTANLEFLAGGGGGGGKERGGALDGSIESFLDFGSIDTQEHNTTNTTTTTTTPSHASGLEESQTSLSSSIHYQDPRMDFAANDLDSFLSLESYQDFPLNDYAMGIPLFPTPTPTLSASPPLQEESTASGSPSSSTSPSSNLQSQLSTPSIPPLNHAHRVQKQKKQKSKPGPKPKPKPQFSSPLEDDLSLEGEDADSPAVLDKRFRNNLAAKKYRQKKVDRISELEAALAGMTKERDELRLLLARKEAEGQVLREVMAKNK
ncbi:hypothetical protein ABW20_dc0107969 [Dactylellina cionopaga]|nr:hypothetical protein ABW20_dc0107969 [Dactylellina cionopaga]